MCSQINILIYYFKYKIGIRKIEGQKIKIAIFLERIGSILWCKCQHKSNKQAPRCKWLVENIQIIRYEYYGRICDSWFLDLATDFFYDFNLGQFIAYQ